jgi:hypothetical protein
MIEAGKMYLKDVPILVDFSAVDNWCEKMMGLMEQPEQYHLEPSWVVKGKRSSAAYIIYWGWYEEAMVPETVLGY